MGYNPVADITGLSSFV